MPGGGSVAAAQSDSLDDVPGDAYYSTPVADLDAGGVFGGTGCEFGFCPNEAIDRKTMAVWVVRVLDGQDPPPISRSRFNDVDAGSFHAAFIERMAELEITGGCGDGANFCPDRSVTRAQMAVFLSRAYDLSDSPDPNFTDVRADAWYAADVARLAASRITAGCGDGTRFCPDHITTRAQMATFLWRAENADWQSGTDDSQTVTVPVFVCAPAGSSSIDDVEGYVELFNAEVSPRWSIESSNKLTLDFVKGSVLSPESVAHGQTIYAVFDACIEAMRPSFYRFPLIVSHYRTTGPNGLGAYGGPAIADGQTLGSHGRSHFQKLVSHELAHSILELPHAPRGRGNLMGVTSGLYGWAQTDGLYLACEYRLHLGWPVGGDSPPCLTVGPARPSISVDQISRSDAGDITVTWTWQEVNQHLLEFMQISGYDTEPISATVRLYDVIRSFNPSGQVAGTSWGPAREEHVVSAGESTYTFAGLVAPASYIVVVGATPAAYDNTDWRAEDVDLVPAPDPVWITEVWSDGFELAWNAVPGAARYRIWHSGMNEDTRGIHPFREGDDLSEVLTWGVSGMEPDTQYTVRVEACGVFEDEFGRDVFSREECGVGTTATVRTLTVDSAPVR